MLYSIFLTIFTFGRHRRKLSVSSKSPAGERPQSLNPIKHLIKEHWRSTYILFRFWKSIHLRKESNDILLSIYYFQRNTVDRLMSKQEYNQSTTFNRIPSIDCTWPTRRMFVIVTTVNDVNFVRITNYVGILINCS